jgi:hypothetical protein
MLPTMFSIPLAERKEKAAMEIVCFPRYTYCLTPIHIKVEVKLKLPKSVGDIATAASIGLLGKDGKERILGETSGGTPYTAVIPHSELLAEAENLLPENQLTIFAKVSISVWSDIEMETRSTPSLEHQKESADCLSEIMLDNFVEIGGSSVLMVFEDGEQRCHSFPLAAREDRFCFFFFLIYKATNMHQPKYLMAPKKTFLH